MPLVSQCFTQNHMAILLRLRLYSKGQNRASAFLESPQMILISMLEFLSEEQGFLPKSMQ